MQLLGIDYGERKIGIAIATTPLAEPLDVLRLESDKEALKRIAKIVLHKGIDKVVIGVPQGRLAKKAKKFGKKLEELVKVKVDFEDEDLSTKDAQRLSIEAGIKRKKRRKLEDAYSAALILQRYLDCVLK